MASSASGKSVLAGLHIKGVDMEGALRQFGSDAIAIEILSTFSADASVLLRKLRMVTPETLIDYAFSIHGLKGCGLNIFAQSIGKRAEKLEEAARAGQYDYIEKHNPPFLQDIEALIYDIRLALEPYAIKEKKESPDPGLLSDLLAACRLVDIDAVDDTLSLLTKYTYNSDDDLIKWLGESAKKKNFRKITQKLSEILES
jgi:hypothetical protein